MQKHTFKDWLTAIRPWSFPASAMPVAVTVGYLFSAHADIDWTNGVWALLNIIVFHAAGNTWSDYFDFRKSVDADDTFGVRTLVSGQFAPKEILILSLALLAAALAGGIGLLLRTGLPLLYIGLAGAACSVFYPFLKYHALGDFVIFAAYALLPMLGTSYVCISDFDWTVLYLAVPVGFITVAILHCNNTRDMDTDRRADISTIAMRLGGRVSVWLYCIEILLPYVWLTVCAVAGLFPLWTLLVWLTVIPAIMNVRTAVSYFSDGSGAIARLDEATAKLQLLFSLVLGVSFVIAGLLG